MSKFSLSCVPRVAKKNAAGVPDASKIEIEAGPTPAKRQRLPEKAPAVVCMYKTTDCASDLWSHFEEGEEAALYQVQIAHQARPSVTYDMVRSFNAFLVATQAEGPKSVRELESQCAIKLVITTTEDQDGIGTFVQWRVAFYVGGPTQDALNNFSCCWTNSGRSKPKRWVTSMCTFILIRASISPLCKMTLNSIIARWRSQRVNCR